MNDRQCTIWETIGIGLLPGIIISALVMAYTNDPKLVNAMAGNDIVNLYVLIFGVEILFSLAGAFIGRFLGRTWSVILAGAIIGSLLTYCLALVLLLGTSR